MKSGRGLHIFADPEEMAAFGLKIWEDVSSRSIDERGVFTVALSGGRTPLVFYRRLARSDHALPWDDTHIFLVDERFVPFDDPESNYGTIKKTLIDPLHIKSGNIHKILPEGSASDAACRYEDELVRFFAPTKGMPPVFDLIMLGIGKDGHTASLFPGAFPQDEESLVIRTSPHNAKHERVTLNLPVINSARNVVFLVSGKNKAEAVREVIEEEQALLPASLVAPAAGRLLFLLDTEAAAECA